MLSKAPGRKIFSKNTIGDCFIILDQDAFPSGSADMIAYLKAIKADLARSQGNVWSKLSFITHSSSYQPDFTASEIEHIDNHFKRPLTVFYVDSHGGTGTAGNGGGVFFQCGGHKWRSTASPTLASSNMAALTASANYGINNPPALVFIDSCFSVGPNPNNPTTLDYSFAEDFDIGDGSSGFIGWADFSSEYGQMPAPQDDWTFWRLDLWTQFTNVNQTYDTAYSRLKNAYHAHGRNFLTPNNLSPEDAVEVLWPSGSSF